MKEFQRDGVAAVTIHCVVDGAHPAAASGTPDLKAIGKEAARRELWIFHLRQDARHSEAYRVVRAGSPLLMPVPECSPEHIQRPL
jgi:hypothetical protein